MFHGLFPKELDFSSDSGENSDEPISENSHFKKHSKRVEAKFVLPQVIEATISEPQDCSSSTAPISNSQFETVKQAQQKFPEECSSQSFQSKDKNLNRYLNINHHLKADINKCYSKKEGIELELEKAIKAGDIEKADQLNDRLAQKDLETQIQEAVKARDFNRKRKNQYREKVAKKRKKLNWGFQTKQRWETKSNM